MTKHPDQNPREKGCVWSLIPNPSPLLQERSRCQEFGTADLFPPTVESRERIDACMLVLSPFPPLLGSPENGAPHSGALLTSGNVIRIIPTDLHKPTWSLLFKRKPYLTKGQKKPSLMLGKSRQKSVTNDDPRPYY